MSIVNLWNQIRDAFSNDTHEDVGDLAVELRDNNWTQIKEDERAANENDQPWQDTMPAGMARDADDAARAAYWYEGVEDQDPCEPSYLTLVGSPEWEEQNEQSYDDGGWENWNSYDDEPGDYADD